MCGRFAFYGNGSFGYESLHLPEPPFLENYNITPSQDILASPSSKCRNAVIDSFLTAIRVECRLCKSGKGGKDRVVFISNDATDALAAYLRIRFHTNEQKVFLVEKGIHKGKPISVRGIQKRIEYYSKKSGISVSCHQLRHTMATQLLNADADLVTIQYLLGHTRIKTTMRYCHLSNMKAQRDYYKAVARVIEKTKGALT